ncbi:MAG: aminotransferase class V-fold PLP-dependent enzyme [Bryobacteraceae bacterium]
MALDPLAWRPQFPVTAKFTYLNHASVAPLSQRCADAMKHLADDACRYGSAHYSDWLETYDGVRSSTARLIHARPQEIAIVKNTSEGIATIALGIDWHDGDSIVVFSEEFPANQYVWQRLESKGVKIRWLSIYDSLDKIDEACRGARLLAISYVNYLSGYRVDLEAIGHICSSHGVTFFVDAIQGLGAFPIDVQAAQIDALAADAHKWLCGPEGCGVLYVAEHLQDDVEPVEFGWTTVAAYNDYASRDLTVRPDAGRYECGTLNTIGCYGVRAAVDLINEVGVDSIAPHVQSLGDQIAEGAVRKGYELLGNRTPETGAGIVSLRKEGMDSAFVIAKLRDHGIQAALRQGWTRLSPHFYITEEDIDKVIELLP